ncbi:MAG: kelch repeat-containing protein [Elusimicrobia bacterium]|nr:kelch repeat-containing protein [Elusimicrobiota bacterium]
MIRSKLIDKLLFSLFSLIVALSIFSNNADAITGTISGTILRHDNNAGIPGNDIIVVYNGTAEITRGGSDGSGVYSIMVNEGVYDLHIGHANYLSQTAIGVTVTANQATPLNISLYNDNSLLDFSWEQRVTTISPARVGLVAATVNNKIYIIGGNNNSGTFQSVEEYDPSSGNIVTRPSLPQPRDWAAVAVVNNKIYVIGGGGGGYYNTVYEYNIAGNTWTVRAPMPTSRNRCSAAVVDNKIYVIGGTNASNFIPLNSVEEYDPQTNAWITKSSMGVARYGAALAVLNNEIYAIGGGGINGNAEQVSTTMVERYNPSTNVWARAEAVFTARREHSAFVLNNKIYVVGESASVEEFDSSTGHWTTKTNVNPAFQKSGFGVGVVKNEVYLIGGFGTNSYQSGIVKGSLQERGLIGPSGNTNLINSAYCYPVPANLTRGDTIKFVNLTGSAKVKILTTSGVTVKDLLADSNGSLAPWDGKDNNGNKIATGTYIVHASDDSNSKPKIFKIIIIK